MTALWQTLGGRDLVGLRAVVTGANSGLGYQSALGLARRGADVLLAVRDPAKGRAAASRIAAETRGAAPSVSRLDLADLSSVAEFAAGESAAALSAGRPIDLLLNNAGVMLHPRRELTADGFELHMGVNHLGHFALTAALLPVLAPRARVVSVSSIAHRSAARVEPDLGVTGPYTPMSAYAQSKLAVLLFGLELDRRLRGSGSTVRSVLAHPGWSATAEEQPADRPGPMVAFSRKATAVLGSRPATGARYQLYAATGPLVRGGDYIGPAFLLRGAPHQARPSRPARSQDQAAWLWERSEQLTRVRFGSG